MGSAMKILPFEHVPTSGAGPGTSDPLNVIHYYGSWPAPVGAAMRIQIGGTFNSASVGVEESLDGVTWISAADVDGTVLSAVTTGAIHALKPSHWLRLLITPQGEGASAITGTVIGPID